MGSDARRVSLIASATWLLCCIAGAGDDVMAHDGDPLEGETPVESGHASGNRLRDANSPYLLQHADNPVDWFPWGAEAFERAAHLDRPIFLSIGYSSCHWCHVMEAESFEDGETARVLNERYVSVKVDREERPDIDHIYMQVCQAMTGSGGWPLTIVMTPDRKPFFAGTYFPKTARFGRPGLVELLTRIAGLWESDRERLVGAGERMAVALSADRFTGGGGRLDAAVIREACNDFAERFDDRHGGFGGTPKFPSPHVLSFLLRMGIHGGDEAPLRMVETTLDAMRRGGICDHLGGGFHRYSTDDRWLVPHFEKMLYDQAMLAVAYAEAYRATGGKEYAETIRDIFAYVHTRMTSPEGGFYSAEDADSDGVEGKYYTWRREEIIEALGAEAGEPFCSFYGVTDEGQLEGRNVLHETAGVEAFAAERGTDARIVRTALAKGRRALLALRDERAAPLLDDKVLTDWNGLMIAALAIGSRALGEERYAERARRAADFILRTMRDRDGRLLHRYRRGGAGIPAYLDDYAFLAWGCLELYEATFEVRYLAEAVALTEEMIDLFEDGERGGFYFTGSDGEALIARMKEIYDGAIPSGNSVAALNLLRLARMTANEDLERRADSLMQFFSPVVRGAPAGFAQLLIALDFGLGPTREIVIAGDPSSDGVRRMIAILWKRFMPRTSILVTGVGPDRKALEAIVPAIAGMTMIEGKPTAYVCENFRCELPVTDVGDLVARIEREEK